MRADATVRGARATHRASSSGAESVLPHSRGVWDRRNRKHRAITWHSGEQARTESDMRLVSFFLSHRGKQSESSPWAAAAAVAACTAELHERRDAAHAPDGVKDWLSGWSSAAGTSMRRGLRLSGVYSGCGWSRKLGVVVVAGHAGSSALIQAVDGSTEQQSSCAVCRCCCTDHCHFDCDFFAKRREPKSPSMKGSLRPDR